MPTIIILYAATQIFICQFTVNMNSQAWGHILIIPATWEAEAGRQVQGQHEKLSETLY